MEELSIDAGQAKKPRTGNIPVIVIILLGIIMLLLACNLSATGYLVYRSRLTVSERSASTSEPLPAELQSVQDKQALFEKFRDLFNSKDSDGLYVLLDPLARLEVEREKFDEQMPLLYQIGSTIKNGEYSHYDYAGISRGRKIFVLHYIVKSDNGDAALNITIAQANQEPYTIWGFHLNK